VSQVVKTLQEAPILVASPERTAFKSLLIMTFASLRSCASAYDSRLRLNYGCARYETEVRSALFPPLSEALTISGGYVMKSAIMLTLFCSLAPSTVVAQTDFLHAWENRVRATSAKQPAWPVPVIGSSSTIVQLVRTDLVRQYTSTHTLTWNYDNGKGVNFIPFARTEFDINLAP
jgi:hypothetical protein